MSNSLQVKAIKSVWSVPTTVGALLLFTILQIVSKGLWYEGFFLNFTYMSDMLNVFLLALVALIGGTLAHLLVGNFNLIRENTLLPFMFFVLMSLQFIIPTTELVTGIAVLFSIGSYFFLFSSYALKNSQRLLFNNALLISIASLFNPQLIFILPIFAPALFMMRIVSSANLLAILFGLIAPYIVALSIYVNSDTFPLWLERITQVIIFDWIALEDLFTQIALNQLFTISIVTAAIIGGMSTFQQDKVKSRSCYQFLMIVFYYAEFIRFSHYSDAEMFGWIANFAGALLLSHYFTLNRSKLTSILFSIVVLAYILLAGYNNILSL
ncbi:MAG: hypothetical protein ACRC6R_03580 [Bacteroidales bacterium]